jgi:tetratricopeptide (TPR) repeat protein
MVALLFSFNGTAEAALKKGEAAPAFKELEAVRKNPIGLLYFFKLGSKPSIEGLSHLTELVGQYQKEGIAVVAISQDDQKLLEGYLKSHPLPFPVVKDDGKIFKQYQVNVILPTTYVLGPGGRISDVLEGGGPSSYRFITTIAERSLQLKKTALARKLFESALKSNPKDIAAQSGLGHVYLKEGKFDRAEAEFSRIAQLKSPEAILGKEGLAELHLQKGESDKALSVAAEVEKEDPNSGLVHLVKGNVLAGQGKQEAALVEFTRATEGKLSSDWQRASAYNSAGRIHSERGEYPLAEKMYQEAVVQNPFSAEILSNRGALYEKQGQPQRALALYQEALSADPEDEISKFLIKRVEQHLTFKEDLERQKRVDTLVAELTDRFQKGAASQLPATDGWSSRPMTVAFLGFKSTGGALLREGMSELLQQEIAQNLMSAGRASIVEREMMEKLLTELKLGSSDLAEPETALRLGKILSARLIVTGSLVSVPNGIRFSLRMIDPETSAIRITYSDEMGAGKNLTSMALQTARTIGRKMKEQYPLKGKIASVEGEDEVSVNLGARHGIKPGTKLRIIDEGEPIVVDGKTIGHRKKKIGLLEIVEVDEGVSFGKLKEQKATIQKEQKVVEEAEGHEKTF